MVHELRERALVAPAAEIGLGSAYDTSGVWLVLMETGGKGLESKSGPMPARYLGQPSILRWMARNLSRARTLWSLRHVSVLFCSRQNYSNTSGTTRRLRI